MSVVHRTKPVDRFSQHRSINRRRGAPVLRRSHRVRELVGQRILSIEVGTIQRDRSLRLGHGAALAEVLGPDR